MSSTHYVVLRILCNYCFFFFFFFFCARKKYMINILKKCVFMFLYQLFFICLVAVQNSEKVHITVVVDVLRWSEALVVLLPGWNK